ncbi:MAG: hypothetical protein IBJ16_14575, partial [Chitinophagaceae bacterium]|nr:hypothetical protein [Chitinophagaceae bacterium]
LRIAANANQSKQQFKALMRCYRDTDYRLTQRAAWSVSWAARKNPEMIQPYIGELVKRLQDDTVHPAVIRNAVRVLEELDIPEEYHGEVMNRCFQFLESPTTPAAIKAFSITVLHHLSKHYPEIKQELKLIIEENWDHETPAFKSRAKKILPSLQ